MADARDPFRVLALPYDADPAAVRRAFRREALRTHPDRGGAPDAFHEVQVAYRTLSADLDGQRRRWQPSAPRPTVRLDRRTYPTCTVRIGRTRDGRRTVEPVLESRPAGWRPGRVAPPGGTCIARVAAAADQPAFGVWTVPLDAHRFRCVFGPPPDADGSRSA